MGEIEKKNNFNKTNGNKNNKDQIGKNNIPLILIEGWDWEKK